MSCSPVSLNLTFSREKPKRAAVTGRRLNTPLSGDTGSLITEAFPHHIAPPERLLYPDRLCEGGYRAINRRQSSSAAATWLLTLSFPQTRGGAVQGSFSTSSLFSHTFLPSANTPLTYLSANCQGRSVWTAIWVWVSVCQSSLLLYRILDVF